MAVMTLGVLLFKRYAVLSLRC